VIKLEIATNGTQTITKVCNMCGCHIDNLTTDDILVKPDWVDSNVLEFKDSQGNEVTRTEIPSDLKECKCEKCND